MRGVERGGAASRNAASVGGELGTWLTSMQVQCFAFCSPCQEFSLLLGSPTRFPCRCYESTAPPFSSPGSCASWYSIFWEPSACAPRVFLEFYFCAVSYSSQASLPRRLLRQRRPKSHSLRPRQSPLPRTRQSPPPFRATTRSSSLLTALSRPGPCVWG